MKYSHLIYYFVLFLTSIHNNHGLANNEERSRLGTWEESLHFRHAPPVNLDDYQNIQLNRDDLQLLQYAPEAYVVTKRMLQSAKASMNLSLLTEDRTVSLLNPDFQHQFGHIALDLIRTERSRVIRNLKAPGTLWDLVIVGSGPNAVAALRGFIDSFQRHHRRPPQILVVEKKNSVSLFSSFGDMFYLNSPIRKHYTKENDTFGSLLPISSMRSTDSVTFPEGEIIGDMSAVELYLSGADILLQSEADSILTTSSRCNNNSQTLEISLKVGNSYSPYKENYNVCTKKIVLATGLGKPAIRVKNGSEIDNWAQDPKSLVYTVDSFLRKSYEQLNSGQAIGTQLQGKKIAVVGAGHGSFIAVEQLLNLGVYPLGYRRDGTTLQVELDEITWFGQESRTKEAFINSLKFATIQERYAEIGSYLTYINKFPGRVSWVEKDGTQYILFMQDGRVSEPFDAVIFATGYENKILSNLLGKKVGTDDITDVYQSQFTNGIRLLLARQFQTYPIYLVGPAAKIAGKGFLPGPDVVGPKKASIEENTPLSYRLGQKIAEN